MIDDDVPDSASDAADPWAPGGSMSNTPIPPPPTFFEPVAPPPTDPATGTPPPAAVALPRGAQIGIALAVVVALIAGGAWLVGRDRTTVEPDAEPTATTPVPSDPVTSEPPTSVADVVPSVVVDEGERLDGQIGFSAALDQVAPTELVVLTDRGEVAVVDTSSGLVSSVLSSVPFGDPQMAVTDNAILLWSSGLRSIVVARRDERPLLLETSVPIGGVVPEADDQFLLQPSDPANQALEARLEPVLRTAEVDFEIGDATVARAHPSGELMVESEGGTYLLVGDQPELISKGTILAVGRNHVLFAVCPDAAPCSFVLDDVASGEQIELPESVNQALLAIGEPSALSPDGSHLARVVSSAGGPMLQLLELPTGATSAVAIAAPAPPTTFGWAADGSGLFVVDDGVVVFVSHATGEVTPLSELTELLAPAGGVVAMAVRPTAPRSSPPQPVETGLSGPTGLDLAALTSTGDVVELDLDGGVFTVHNGLPLRSGASAYLFPTATGAAVESWDTVPGFRLVYGSDPEPTDGSAIRGQVYPGPEPDTVWRSRTEDTFNGELRYDLIDLDGMELGASIEIDNAFPIGPDGRGALMIVTTGGIYVASAGSVAQRVTTGDPIAVGPTTIYARECDEVLTCGVVRIDRENGSRTLTADPALSVSTPYPESEGSAVSPDGDVIFLQNPQFGLGWSIVDVRAGAAFEVPGPQNATPIVWSADSRFAVYLSGERLQIFDRAVGETIALTDLPPLRTVAEVQPSAGP